jgi:hypothetical protein
LPRISHLAQVVAVLGVAAILAGALADFFASRYLLRWRQRYSDEVREERTRLGRYKRPLTFEDPLDQNGAIWYRLALEKLRYVSPDTISELRDSVNRGVRVDPETLRRTLQDRCLEVGNETTRNAFRCTRCDWGLGYEGRNLADFDSSPAAAALANCLVLSGHQQEQKGHWRAAVQTYFEVIAFGCDLGAGDFTMNIMGIGSARLGLTALANLITVVDDPQLLSDTSRQLDAIEGKMPTAEDGIIVERLRLADALAVEADAYIHMHATGMRRLFPWRAIIAWRIRATDPILLQLDSLGKMRDPRARVRLDDEIGHRAATIPFQTIRDGMVAPWAGVMSAADDVARWNGIAGAALKFQDWHRQHRVYPVGSLAPDLVLALRGLQYEPLAGGEGYRISEAATDSGKPTILLERRPDHESGPSER